MGSAKLLSLESAALAAEIRLLVGDEVTNGEIDRIVSRVAEQIASKPSLTSRLSDALSSLTSPTLRIAILVVDFQNDFVSGSLTVKGGKQAIPTLNELLKDDSADMVVYTMDWHPPNHISFLPHCRNSSDRRLSEADRARSLKDFDEVTFDIPSVTQRLYPIHCVGGSWGADLYKEVYVVKEPYYVKKGKDVLIDSYSAFQDNGAHKKTELADLLREHGVTAVIGVGLAYDICVQATLRDAVDAGFLAAIATDASAGLDEEGVAVANELFRQRGIAILDKGAALGTLRRKTIPIQWVEQRIKDALQHSLPAH